MLPSPAADVAEQVAALDLRELAREFEAVGSQAGDDALDVSTANRMRRLPRVFAGAFLARS
jgi:hypothetical protein